MVKYYCDGCGVEVTEANRCCGGAMHCPDSRLGGEITAKSGVRLRIEIITSLDGVANRGCFCKQCVVDAIVELAKPVPEKPRIRPLRTDRK